MPTANSGRSRYGIGVPNVATSLPIVRAANDGNSPIHPELNRFITGVTRDSVGAALASCTVYIFRSDGRPSLQVVRDIADLDRPLPPTYVWTGVSDGSGNFTAGPLSGGSGYYFGVAWNAAGTVAGITLNTLVPA